MVVIQEGNALVVFFRVPHSYEMQHIIISQLP